MTASSYEGVEVWQASESARMHDVVAVQTGRLAGFHIDGALKPKSRGCLGLLWRGPVCGHSGSLRMRSRATLAPNGGKAKFRPGKGGKIRRLQGLSARKAEKRKGGKSKSLHAAGLSFRPHPFLRTRCVDENAPSPFRSLIVLVALHKLSSIKMA